MTRGFHILAFSLMCAAPAAAGSLAPSKPSQLVTLEAINGTAGNCATPISTWLKVTSQVNPDGSETPLAIPTGMVLVLTGAEWSDQGTGGAADVARFLIRLQNGTQDPLAAFGSGATGTTAGGGSVSFPNGIAVKPGTDICVTSTATVFVGATVHGYLTRDK
jgi:hypothetical protein